jgi:hypothetical protein
MSLDVIIDKIKGNIDAEVRYLTLDLDYSIVKTTPVDTGRAKGNWLPSIGSPITEEIDRLDPTGEAVMNEIASVVPLKAGQVVWLSNNVHYIQKLEYGHSPQAGPHAMVRLNVLRIAGGYK